MKKLIVILITIALLVGVVSAAVAASPKNEGSGNAQYAASVDFMKKAHGSHGLGNVNQFFNGVDVPPPWDLPPGRQP